MKTRIRGIKKKKKAAEKKGSGLEAQEGTVQSAYLMFWVFYVNLFYFIFCVCEFIFS